MVLVGDAGEEMQSRNPTLVKGEMVPHRRAAVDLFQLQRRLAVGAIQERVELLRRPGAEDRQLVIAEPADHVKVQHGHRIRHREQRVFDVILAAHQPFLLAAETDEDQPSSRLLAACCQPPRQLQNGRRAGGVVVRPVVDFAAVRLARAELAAADVVVMRAEHDRLLRQRPLALQHADDVRRLRQRPLEGRLHVHRPAGQGLRNRPKLAVNLLFRLDDVGQLDVGRRLQRRGSQQLVDDRLADLGERNAFGFGTEGVRRRKLISALGRRS